MIKRIAAAQSLRVTSTIDRLDGIFPPESEINLYRIVQESLNNIIKHSNATEVTITIAKTAHAVEMMVADNGKGFAPNAAITTEPGRGGFGLTGMAERARTLGGKLAVQSTPGQGTVVAVKIELRDTRHEK